MNSSDKKDRMSTRLCHDDTWYTQHQGAVVPPIYQNSTFVFPDWSAIEAAFGEPERSAIYTRGNNPTVGLAEEKLAELAGAQRARLFASGMGAISAAILHCVKQGDHILTVRNIYGPAQNFIRQYLSVKCGIAATFLSGTDPQAFVDYLRPNTRLIYLESPASATFELQDLEAIADIARSRGIKTVIDNTLATPVFQRPLELGIDLEVHSGSKYLGGHSDLVCGVIMGRESDLNRIILAEQAWLGAKMSPFEAWLLLRSLRTLPARMRLHQQQALYLARWLEGHPAVRKVYYPGLPSFPQYDLARRQMRGTTGLLSIELATDRVLHVQQFVDQLRLFKLGVSWGGHESLVYAPLISYLREMGEEQFRKTGIPPGLIRLSVGLEDSEDLKADLDQALAWVPV